ncbi:hypothetical protein Hamer_G009734, partial [Homarus americanus]
DVQLPEVYGDKHEAQQHYPVQGIYPLIPPPLPPPPTAYCDDTMEFDLPRLCRDITGDAMLYSMFRLNSEPVACPFHGPLTFTYSRGYGECEHPVSQVDSCADDSRLLFRHQACADVPGSESFVEELVCLASWKEGSNHYLVGKVDHIHVKSDEDRYRCFIYEHPRHQGNTQTWNLAQSADATCQGLISAHEGSKTMKLSKVTHNGRKCKFPSWLTVHSHWHTLDNSKSYFVYHKNTSIRISDGTAAPEDIEVSPLSPRDPINNVRSSTSPSPRQTRGHTDFRLVCHNKSGYQCLRIYRRDEHVVQVRSGELGLKAEEACSSHYWSPTTANLTTLVAAGGPPGPCGPFGRYHVPDALVPCAGESRTFTHITVGCNSGNTLQLDARCPEKTVYVFHCHGQWTSEGVTYVVASPMSRASGAPRRVCFAYSDDTRTNTLTLTARHDTCIQRQHDAHIAINATLAGQCVEGGRSNSGGSKRLAGGLLHLICLLILTIIPACVVSL